MYELDPDLRRMFPYSCHRFIIIGGRRTGAVLHQDPKATLTNPHCFPSPRLSLKSEGERGVELLPRGPETVVPLPS